MISRSVPRIKRAQKESTLLRTLAPLIHRIVQDHPELVGVSVTRVELSQDKSMATVFFYMTGGHEAFKQIRPILTLYKPGLRKAVADSMNSRYTCNLRFVFDAEFERIDRIERLLDRVKEEDAEIDARDSGTA